LRTDRRGLRVATQPERWGLSVATQPERRGLIVATQELLRRVAKLRVKLRVAKTDPKSFNSNIKTGSPELLCKQKDTDPQSFSSTMQKDRIAVPTERQALRVPVQPKRRSLRVDLQPERQALRVEAIRTTISQSCNENRKKQAFVCIFCS
jgi:hypothetical protein